MDTFWSFRKPLTRSICGQEKFLKTRIMETEGRNWLKWGLCLWNANGKLAFSLVYAYKYWQNKICRLHQRIHISINEIHIFNDWNAYNVDYCCSRRQIRWVYSFKLTERPRTNSDQNNYIYRLFQKRAPCFKVQFWLENIFIPNSTKFITNSYHNLPV